MTSHAEHGDLPRDDAAEPASAPSLRWTWALWVIAAAFVLLQPNYQWTDGARSAPYGSDFLQDWIGGRIILAGNADRLYDWDYSASLQSDPAVVGYRRTDDGYYPMVYPPYWYIACVPLATIPLRWAAIAWLVILVGAWFVTIRWVGRTDCAFGRAFARSPQIGLFTAPLLLSLAMGQKALLMAAVLLAVVVLLEQNRLFRAGLLLGLLAFKPHMVLLLALPLTCRFGFRLFWGLAAAGAFWLSLTVAVDPSLLISYFSVVSDSIASGYSSHAGYELGESHNWHSFWVLLCGADAGGTTANVFSICTVAVASLICCRHRRKPLTLSEWNVVVVGAILASPHLYTYDLTLLIVNAWIGLRRLDTDAEKSVAFGIAAWLTLSIGPTMTASSAVPVQWTVVLLATAYGYCVLLIAQESAPKATLDARRTPSIWPTGIVGRRPSGTA